MAKQEAWRYKVNKYVFLPIYVIIMLGLAVAATSVYIGGLTATAASDKEDGAFIGLVISALLAVFSVLPAMAKAIDGFIDKTSTQLVKPLLCSCGHNHTREYTLPQLLYLAPIVFIGIAIATGISYIVWPTADIFLLLEFCLALAGLLFLLGLGEFIIRGHTLACSARRGFMSACYFVFAAFASRVLPVYSDRKSDKPPVRDPKWLEPVQIGIYIAFLALCTIFFQYL